MAALRPAGRGSGGASVEVSEHVTVHTSGNGAASVTDQEIVSRIGAGDVEAFEVLYRRYAASMARFAYSQLRSVEAAEDVVQEVFLALWRHRERWVLSGTVQAYLFGALRNGIVSHRRKQLARGGRLERVGEGVIAALPSASRADDRVREAELVEAIEKAIDGLTPRCREAFLLVRQQHLSYAEAAEVMGVSVKAVEMSMVRALAALRKQLADWCE